MSIVQIPVFANPREPSTMNMYINTDRIFFIAPAEVPTPVVGPDKQPITKRGTLISSGSGGGLMADMLPEDLLQLLGYEVEEKQDGGEPETEVCTVPSTTGDAKPEVQPPAEDKE